MESEEEISLAFTPTWALSSVIIVMVVVGYFFQFSLDKFGEWLKKANRKALIPALEKIKDELMLFAVLSLLMSDWKIHFVKICVKSSASASVFFLCGKKKKHHRRHHRHCPEGYSPFASYQSLERLHRLMFVLAMTHVSYSFIAITLGTVKICSWRAWENQAKSKAVESTQASDRITSMRRLNTFISRHASHPWSQHGVLVWLLCFSRQFWSSVSHSDYEALRLSFINKHHLPLAYDFHSYMLRNIELEFSEIVGIGIPLWIYAICGILLDFHGSFIYFCLSFLPAILILLIGTKLQRVVVKLALEITSISPEVGHHHEFKLDEFFWFGKPKLLLWLIQLISFQNAFEMATLVWSMWEIKHHACFMNNGTFAATRIIFGLLTQFWCSFITFPLYVIVAQMGKKPNRSVVSDNVWQSLHGWQNRAKSKKWTKTHSSSSIPFLRSRSYS